MASACLAIVCGLRTSIDVAFIAMINHTAVEESVIQRDGVCQKELVAIKDGPFAWDATTERVLRTSYNLGMLVSQIPGAFMTLKSSAKWTVYIATLLDLVSAAVFPVVVVNTDWSLLSFLLLFQGFCGGIIFPCMITIISNWAHPNERSTFCGIVFAGQPLGYLCGSVGIYTQHLAGWKFNFQYMLLFTLPWLILWPLWSNSTPVTSELASHAERSSILNAQRGSRTYSKLNFPFKMIRASSAFWVLACAYFGANCMYYTLLFEMQHYFHEVLLVHYEQLPERLIPPIVMLVVCVSSGIFIDFIKKRKSYDTALTRKTVATIAGLMVPAFCLLGMHVTLVCNVATVMILLTIAVGTMGAVPVAILVNHVDLTPNFAGALMGVTGTLANIPQFLMPTIMGSLFISGEHTNLHQRWTAAFTSISVVNITACIVFIVWGKGDVQPWNSGRQDYRDSSLPSVGEGRNLGRARSVGSYGSSVPSGSLKASESTERPETDKTASVKTDAPEATQEKAKRSNLAGTAKTSDPQSTIRTAGTAGTPITSDAHGNQGTSRISGAIESSRSS